jgi:hypothetical protein
MLTVDELESAFAVYFQEIERCRAAECYWALLHVIVILPDICAALEADNGWATQEKYVDWCRRYCPTCNLGMLTAEDYRDIRNIVLHQGRTLTQKGRYYKFTRPTERGGRAHRLIYGPDLVVLDVGELANDFMTSIRVWFRDLQAPEAQDRRANVQKNLPSLVTVREQELPLLKGVTFTVTQTATGPVFRPMP